MALRFTNYRGGPVQKGKLKKRYKLAPHYSSQFAQTVYNETKLRSKNAWLLLNFHRLFKIDILRAELHERTKKEGANPLFNFVFIFDF